MQVTILTLPFDPATGGFRTEPLDALRRRCEVLRVQPAFFTHQETAYWTLVVMHRLRAAPEEAAVRRGVERTTLPASAAVSGGSVAGVPFTGGDLRSDPRGDLLSAADASLYQELRVWRAEVADVAGIPVFMILTNRQLRDIMRVRPASLAALGGISGIGQARLQKHGPARVAPVHGPQAGVRAVQVSVRLRRAPARNRRARRGGERIRTSDSPSALGPDTGSAQISSRSVLILTPGF